MSIGGWAAPAVAITVDGTVSAVSGYRRALVMGRWKLVFESDQEWELYDLENDPAERENLASRLYLDFSGPRDPEFRKRKKHLIGLYDGEAAYTDEYLGGFLRVLERQGLLRRHAPSRRAPLVLALHHRDVQPFIRNYFGFQRQKNCFAAWFGCIRTGRWFDDNYPQLSWIYTVLGFDHDRHFHLSAIYSGLFR